MIAREPTGGALALELLARALQSAVHGCDAVAEELGHMIREGESSEAVVQGLPPEWRPGTRALPLEIFRLPD